MDTWTLCSYFSSMGRMCMLRTMGRCDGHLRHLRMAIQLLCSSSSSTGQCYQQSWMTMRPMRMWRMRRMTGGRETPWLDQGQRQCRQLTGTWMQWSCSSTLAQTYTLVANGRCVWHPAMATQLLCSSSSSTGRTRTF